MRHTHIQMLHGDAGVIISKLGIPRDPMSDSYQKVKPLSGRTEKREETKLDKTIKKSKMEKKSSPTSQGVNDQRNGQAC